MKIIFTLLPMAALWLLSANEQGLVGNIGVWTSLAIFLSFVVLQWIAGATENE